MGRGLLLAMVIIVGAGAAWAQEAKEYPTPVAPPESGVGYDVPVPGYIVDVAIAHRRAFIEGVAAEAVSLSESDTQSGMGLVVSSARELSDVTGRVEGTMSSIGEIDSAFGIRGISRLVTAEGAVRDTLFGFVVWHESAAGESRRIARDLERTVDHLLALGQAAARLGNEVSASSRSGRRALDERRYEAIAESAFRVNEETTNLGAVSDEIVTTADSLEEIVWEIREGGGSLLSAEWDEVLLAVSEARRLAARMRPALDEARNSTAAFGGMATTLEQMLGTLEMIESAPSDAQGRRTIPWKLFLIDHEVITAMLDRLVASEDLPDGVLTRASELARRIVVADRLLVEYASLHVGSDVAAAADVVESRYLREVGYNEAEPQRRRLELLAEVDGRMRQSLELQSSLLSARSMRAALAAGRAAEVGEIGTEKTALRHYKNAWLHAINAGAMAQRATSK